MSRPLLSIVVPVRDRSGLRLENCLRSFRWQEVDPAAVEIVLSDFGSTEPHRQSMEELAGQHGARIIRTETNETWNRSRALNIGIQAARADLLLCTDADIMLQPNFVATLLSVHGASGDGPTMIHCRCHDLPEALPEQLWAREDFPELVARATVRTVRGTGACQSAPTDFFRAVRGYDEKFRYWGAEDVDMTSRAERFGARLEWISHRTSMLHQYHPTAKHDRMLLWRLNRWRYRLTRWKIVKNPRGWGSER